MSNHKYGLLMLALISILALSACSGQISSAPSIVLASAPVDVLKTTSIQQVGSNLDPLAAYQDTLEQIYQKVNPSVVNVEVSATVASPFFGRRSQGNGGQIQQTALGSGFVWDNQGHIVTNNHVVDGADKITVTFADGTVANAKVVGKDVNSDLAVIQVNVPAGEPSPIELTDSAQVKVGQMAVAIGNPFGLSGTMTVGVISGLDRSLPVGLDSNSLQQSSGYSIPDIIQTDASINPGNSGGVLVDDQGQLIGVTAAIASPVDASAGVGFVIPSLIVQKVVPALIKTGHYNHPWLGFDGTALTPDLAQANNLDANLQGVMIVDVAGNSPASKAGLRGSQPQIAADGTQIPVGGDIVTAIDSHAVKTFEDLGSYLFENTQVGQKVTLDVLRNGVQKSIELTLGVLPATGN
jgi:serine protease Do